MKKKLALKPSLKLSLNRETVRRLTGEEAAQVYGGDSADCTQFIAGCVWT